MQDNKFEGLAILSVTFTNSNNGWILTPAQLMETTNGGETWVTRLESESADRSFYSLAFVTSSMGFIVGTQQKNGKSSALILRTNDSGKSWQEALINVIPQSSNKENSRLFGVSFCNSQVGWAVGSNMIVRTDDSGQTWKIQYGENKKEFLLDVVCISPERAYAVGQDGVILHTEDSGKSWVPEDSGTTDNLVQVRFFGDTYWIVGGLAGKGNLLRKDKSAKWKRVQISSSEALFDIYISGQHGWLVGASGTIFHTINGGQTWQREKSPTDNDLITIFFLNPNQGWIGGNKRTVLSLTN